MILLKITVTVVIVTGLSVVAERISPRAAGILAGYPAGSAIALFFIGMEQGAAFAGASALYNVLGLTALLCFLYTYYRVTAGLASAHPAATILTASAGAVGAFLAAVALLHALRLPPWAGLLVTVTAIPFFSYLFRAIPETQVTRRVRLGLRVLVFRSAVSAAIILAITGAARLVPAPLAGLFSAFPASAFPLILIVHGTYGAAQAHAMIRHMPLGLGSLALYSLVVSAVYPRFGIGWGTVLAFGAATVYLVGVAMIQRSRREI